MKKYILAISLIISLNACSLIQSEDIKTYDLPGENGEIMDLARETKDVDLLAFLAKHENQGVRANVAGNIHTSESILKSLSDDQAWEVLSYLGSNKNTPQDTLKKLGKHEDERVRWVVAKNPITSKEILNTFVEDSSNNVQRYLTENKSLDFELMMQIVEKSMPSTLLSLLDRDDLPDEIVNILMQHSDDKVREKAENWKKAQLDEIL